MWGTGVRPPRRRSTSSRSIKSLHRLSSTKQGRCIFMNLQAALTLFYWPFQSDETRVPLVRIDRLESTNGERFHVVPLTPESDLRRLPGMEAEKRYVLSFARSLTSADQRTLKELFEFSHELSCGPIRGSLDSTEQNLETQP